MTKPVRSHKQITSIREIIEVNLGMIEDDFGLPLQSEDSMTAINFVNAQIEAEESPLPFASELDRMGFTRTLHELKLEYETDGKLDLGQTFDKLTKAFRVRVETIIDDDTLQSALTAQIQPQRKFWRAMIMARDHHHHRGIASPSTLSSKRMLTMPDFSNLKQSTT